MPGGITVRSWPIVTSGMRTNSVPGGIIVEDETLKIGVYCNYFRSQHRNKEVALDQLFRMRTELADGPE